VPTFCRHNRFFADCPICSKGTVLDPARSAARRPRTSTSSRSAGASKRRSAAPAAAAARPSRGPFVSAGPYDGAEIRLERVPGGLRMASWRGGQIERTAPVLAAADAPGLLAEAVTKELLAPAQLPDGGTHGEVGDFGASPGRSGELRDELRVERLDEGRIRVARWILRPNRGWELQKAPVMLPPARFAQALAAAVGKGVLASGGPAR
jgi:hypothetical protein